MEIASGPLAIGTLSKRTGCKIETIRYYERAGLIPHPLRSPGGYRLYGTAQLKRLTFIRRARALGFSIEEVRALLNLADHRRRPCTEARAIAAAHLSDVRAKIADLKMMELVLRRTVARCTRRGGSHCPLIEALSRDGRLPPADRAVSPERTLPDTAEEAAGGRNAPSHESHRRRRQSERPGAQ